MLAIGCAFGASALFMAGAIYAAPVSLTNLGLIHRGGESCLTPCLSRAGSLLTLSYDLNNDARMTAVVRNPFGSIVRTLVKDKPVPKGDHRTVAWNGLGAAGTRLPDDLYTIELTVVDSASTTATARQQVILDGRGPTITFPRSRRLSKRTKLVVHFADLHGLARAKLFVNHDLVAKLKGNHARLAYRPAKGWRRGRRYVVNVIARDKLGNRSTQDATFRR